MNVFGGVIVGMLVATVHNRFYKQNYLWRLVTLVETASSDYDYGDSANTWDLMYFVWPF